MTSVTSELAILANDPPMTIPIAISTTLPRMANSLNSLMMFLKYIKTKLRILTVSSSTCKNANPDPGSPARIGTGWNLG